MCLGNVRVNVAGFALFALRNKETAVHGTLPDNPLVVSRQFPPALPPSTAPSTPISPAVATEVSAALGVLLAGQRGLYCKGWPRGATRWGSGC